MKQNRLILFIATMSVLVMIMFNFTMYSQQQMYELEQYRLAILDYNKDKGIDEDGIITFPNSSIQFSRSIEANIDDGLVLSDDTFYHVVSGNKKQIAVDEITSINEVFEQYLVYYYTFYLSPILILFLILLSVGKSVVGLVAIYVIHRLIIHKKRRDEIYVVATKFFDNKLILAVTILGANTIFAYSSFFIGYKLSTIMYIIIVAICYAIALEANKRFLIKI